MVFELELLGADTLVFLVSEISEHFVRGELGFIELSHDYWVFLHFAEESVDSFVIIVEELGLN